MIRFKRKNGIALVSVMIVCTVIIIMLGILYSNTRSKSHTQKYQYDSTRALLAANAAIQLAVYKFRALPAEYYKIYQKELDSGFKPDSVTLEKINKAKEVWLSDLNTLQNGDTATKIKTEFDNHAKLDGIMAEHDFCVASFTLISLEDDGYKKDYIKINAWGKCNSIRKDIEELIEASLVE